MELAEVLDGIRSQESAIRSQWSSGDRENVGAERGERPISAIARREDPRYLANLVEAAKFYGECVNGRRASWQLREAMTTSDFPLLFGDIIDRQALGNYRETPVTYPAYARLATVRDFRTVKRFAINGSEAVLGAVDQQGEYPESSLSDVKYQYAVSKFGRQVPFAWETMIDDDLQMLQDVPARMGKAARRSEEKFVTQLFVSSTGPNATFFSSGNKNLDTAGALTIARLQAMFVLLATQLDADGEPIAIDGVTLVVPPNLEVTAQNIINATQLWVGGDGQAEAGGTAGQRLISANWMQRRVTLRTNYYLPIVDTTHGATAYYLFASPGTARPPMEFGRLRGHEEPEMFVQSPNAQRLGGADVNPMDGSFENDSIRYKVRHVFGGVLMDPKMAVANAGA